MQRGLTIEDKKYFKEKMIGVKKFTKELYLEYKRADPFVQKFEERVGGTVEAVKKLRDFHCRGLKTRTNLRIPKDLADYFWQNRNLYQKRTPLSDIKDEVFLANISRLKSIKQVDLPDFTDNDAFYNAKDLVRQRLRLKMKENE